MKLASWCGLALVVAGCGSYSSSGGGGMAGPSSTSPSTGTVMVGANGSTSFTPQTINIATGGKVTWQWLGGPHTVTSGAPGAVDGKFCSMAGTPSPAACNSTNYAQSSGTYSHTFASAGTYPYFCTVHGVMMTGNVVVGGSSGGGGGGGGGGSGGSGGGGY